MAQERELTVARHDDREGVEMMNEPTSSATTPKMSRNVLKNDRLSFRSFWLSGDRRR
jgi:hypothetical protein